MVTTKGYMMPNTPHPANSRHGSLWKFESHVVAAVADAEC